MSIQETMVDEPVTDRPRRGSFWLGIGISGGVMLGRLGIHYALSDPPAPHTPEAATWHRLYTVLNPLAFDPRILFVGLFSLGLVLSLIPRTRRTGVGVLLGALVSLIVALILLLLIVQALSHASIEP